MTGVVGAVEWLRDVNLGKQPYVGENVVVGRRVVIQPLTAARTAKRLKSDHVTLLYRRLREGHAGH